MGLRAELQKLHDQGVSGGCVPACEPADLASRESKSFSGSDGFEFTVDDGLEALQSIEIAHCKCHSRALPHSQSPVPGKGGRNYSRAALKRTFESSQNRTFELGCYTSTSHNVYYVKSQNSLHYRNLQLNAYNQGRVISWQSLRHPRGPTQRVSHLATTAISMLPFARDGFRTVGTWRSAMR